MDDLKAQSMPHRTYIAWGVILMLFTGSLFLLALFLSEMKAYRFIGQGIELRNTITISGTGEATAVPDTAEFSFAIFKRESVVAEAQKAVTIAMNAILEYLKESGIEEKDIKTTSYNIVPRYEYKRDSSGSPEPLFYPPTGRQVLVGYEVSHWVEIKVRDTEKIGELIAHVGSRGATNISSVQFTIDDEEKIKRDARKKAIADAEEKARVLAKDLGVRLVKIVNFSESGNPIYYARALATEEVAAGGDAFPSPEIPVGENTITSNVVITWAIE